MGQKILVVEDNELNLKLFCDLLRAHGYAAEPVRDGREAIERARAFSPDLVVMDIQMPYISGLELIEQMKVDSSLRSVPIMAVTAYAAKGDEERIREAGAEGYVSKPISVMRFVEAVRALLAAPRPVLPDLVPVPEPEPEPGAEAEAEIELHAEDVRVTQRFEAAPERVFDAWIDPEIAGLWLFRTPEGALIKAEIDAKPGGRYEIVERRDGEDVLHTGLFEAVDRPRRLVFTLQVPRYSQDEARIEVELSAREDGCELALTQSLPPNAPVSREQVEQGWATLLAALARVLKGEPSGDQAPESTEPTEQ